MSDSLLAYSYKITKLTKIKIFKATCNKVLFMKYLEINALLDGQKRVVNDNANIKEYYDIWKDMRKDFGDNSEFEAFVAGWVIGGGNPVLKEKFIKIRQSQHILESKINYSLRKPQ